MPMVPKLWVMVSQGKILIENPFPVIYFAPQLSITEN